MKDIILKKVISIDSYTNILEDFLIVPMLKFPLFNIVFITPHNITHIIIICFTMWFFYSQYVKTDTNGTKSTFFIIPSILQAVIEKTCIMLETILQENIKDKEGQKYLPYIFFLFFFITLLNVFGQIPYNFSITSQIISTFGFGLLLSFHVVFIMIKKHGIHMFNFFLPSGTSPLLALILVPIEIISFIFRPFSLATRLFANMMAGHTLLKVLTVFVTLITKNLPMFAGSSILPLLCLIVILMFFEFAVAIVQAFVFTLLACIYINEAIKLH